VIIWKIVPDIGGKGEGENLVSITTLSTKNSFNLGKLKIPRAA
jgi:hypothetical protein